MHLVNNAEAASERKVNGHRKPIKKSKRRMVRRLPTPKKSYRYVSSHTRFGFTILLLLDRSHELPNGREQDL